MKRLSKKAYANQRRLHEKRERRRLKAIALRRERRYAATGITPPHKRTRVRLFAPTELDIYSTHNHRRTAKFLRTLRHYTLISHCAVTLDFSNTTRVTAAATLMLLAEVDRSNQLSKHPTPVRGTIPIDTVVAQAFHQIGLDKLMGITRTIPITHPEVTYWHYFSSSNVANEIVGELIEDLVGTRFDHDFCRELFEGVTEAITNTVHHSSLCGRTDGTPLIPDRWWLFAGIRNDQFAMVVCDLGIGIPESIPIQWNEQVIRRLLAGLGLARTDGTYIRLSMELLRTRTRMSGRGYGMGNLREVITEIRDGTLAIYSNRGSYSFRPISNDEATQDYKHSLPGTIIEWTVPLDKAQNAAAAPNP